MSLLNKDSSYAMFSPSRLPEETLKGYPNPSKVVKLYLATDNDNSWKNNLYRIYNGLRVEGLDMELLKVDNNIELTFEKFPDISYGSKFSTFKDDLFKVLESFGAKGKAISKTLSSDKVANAVNIATNAATVLTTQGEDTSAGSAFNPWFLNTPTWTGDSVLPLEFKMDFEFRLGQFGFWNAFEEVYKPAVNLVAPCLLRHNGLLSTMGPAPNAITLTIKALESLFGGISNFFKRDSGGTTPDTPEPEEDADANLLTKVADILTKAIQTGYNGYIYSLDIGHFVSFKNVFIESGSLVWGTEVDNYGYPTYAKVTLNFKTLTPPALTNVNSMAQAIRFGGN